MIKPSWRAISSHKLWKHLIGAVTELLFIFIFAAALVIIMQWSSARFHWQDINLTWPWFSLNLWCLNILLACAVVGIIRILAVNVGLYVALVVIVGICAAGSNSLKVKFLGEPLMVTDSLLIQDVGLVWSFVSLKWRLMGVIGLIFVISMLIRSFRYNRNQLSRTVHLRRLLIAVGITIISFLYWSSLIDADGGRYTYLPMWPSIAQGSYISWEKITPMQERGWFAFTADELRAWHNVPRQLKPKVELRKIRDSWGSCVNTPPTGVKIVIAVLVESLWDPLSSGVQFAADPMPNLRSLEKDGEKINLVVPGVGGLTANAEYELLTGLSTSVLPPGALPYTEMIKKLLPAVPAIFHENGFRSVAVHNFWRKFWARGLVYPLIGFDQFISLENMPFPETPLGFPSDKALFDRVRDEALKDDGRNKFIFGVTVEMHGGYEDRPGTTNLLASEELLKQNSKLNVYANRLRRTDADIGAFIRDLKKSQIPAVVLLFGDHIPPGLPAEYFSPTQVARTSGLPQVHLTPGYFFRLGDVKVSAMPTHPLSLSCLAPLLLKDGGVTLPPFYAQLGHICDKYPAFNITGVSSSDQASMDNYKTVNYDRLVGERVTWVRCTRQKHM